MSVYCLIHGTALSDQGWHFLAPLLEAGGHRVVAPHLPGGVREEGVEALAGLILEALADVDAPVTLVGHGAAGLLLPVVASRRPAARMIFLAALVPRLGLSLLDAFQAEPDMYTPDWLAAGEADADPTRDRAVADRFLFHDCPPDVADWAWQHAMQPMVMPRAFAEPLPLGAWPDVPSSILVPEDDRTLSPDWMRRAAEALGVAPTALPGGHCPFLSRPALLAEVLAVC